MPLTTPQLCDGSFTVVGPYAWNMQSAPIHVDDYVQFKQHICLIKAATLSDFLFSGDVYKFSYLLINVTISTI